MRSIIGRYLEHARVYHFGNGAGEAKPVTYMGSADLMQRNLDHRVETLVALADPKVAGQVLSSLQMELTPNLQSWYLAPDGGWTRDASGELVDLHTSFEEMAKERRRAGKLAAQGHQ